MLFFVPGLFSLISYFANGKRNGNTSIFPIAGVGSILFGLWLIIMPSFFVNILMYVLGFILVLGGIQQIVSLVSARKWTSVPLGFYIVPTLILVAGVVVLANPFKVASGAFILLGVSCLVYALSELLNGFKFTRKVDEIQ